MDQQLKPGAASVPLVRLGEIQQEGAKVSVAIAAGTPAVGASLHFTAGTGPWQNRKWETLPAAIAAPGLSAVLPDMRPLAYFLAVTDARGFTTSTSVVEFNQP
jgi:hypothetical protein